MRRYSRGLIMKRISLPRLHARILAVAIAALMGTPALAAGLAAKAPLYTKAPPPPRPEPVYSWTGFYVGANAGYGWKDPTVTVTPNDGASRVVTSGLLGGAPPASFNINGGLGGLQAGYNWQFKQNWLLGFETDFDWSRIRGAGVAGSPSNFQASENVRWFGTVRGRVGFLPTNSLLVYGTGGFAYGRVDENVAFNGPTGLGVFFPPTNVGFMCNAGPNCFLGSSSRTATGWTAGGGFEYALWNNISVKAEYLYVNLGGDAVNVVAQAPAGPGVTLSSFTAAYSPADFHVVRAGVNWKF